MIDAHPTMEGYINKRDKELSWDGYIRLYQRDNCTSDKVNFDDDVHFLSILLPKIKNILTPQINCITIRYIIPIKHPAASAKIPKKTLITTP